MTSFSGQLLLGLSPALVSVPPLRTYLPVIISTDLHLGEPGQLRPLASPLTCLPPPPLYTACSPVQTRCRAWMTDGHSLIAGHGAGQAKPGCLPGDWPCVESDSTHWLLRLGSVSFLLPHHTACSSLTPSCRIAMLHMG